MADPDKSKLLSITTQLHCDGHLVGERDCRTQFWKRTIQWLFHPSLVLIELLVPDKMVFMWMQSRSPTKMAATLQLCCYWKQLWSRWAITGSWEPLVLTLQSNWFQTRGFLCEFPTGSYVKLSSAVGAILVEGPNRLTYFWKRTIQWLFHQHLVLIGWNLKKIFSSETTEPIATKLCWNDPWVVPFQTYVWHFRPPTKMATTAELNLT
jgi:hypothetical protein